MITFKGMTHRPPYDSDETLDEGTGGNVVEVDEDDILNCPGCGQSVVVYFDRGLDGNIALDEQGRATTSILHPSPPCGWVTAGGEVRGWLEGLLDEVETKDEQMRWVN